MFIAPLFIIAKLWKQPDALQLRNGLRKCDMYIYVYKIEYYSAIKKNGIMSFADKWIELENIILSEVNQVQKDK
jgi:hypothetical protein